MQESENIRLAIYALAMHNALLFSNYSYHNRKDSVKFDDFEIRESATITVEREKFYTISSAIVQENK